VQVSRSACTCNSSGAAGADGHARQPQCCSGELPVAATGGVLRPVAVARPGVAKVAEFPITKAPITMSCATSLQSNDNDKTSRGASALIRFFLAALAMFCLPSLASAQSANLWIDGSGGSCTRQASAAGYSDATACGSIQAAVAACAPGDVIRMKAGSYGSQAVTANKTSPGCTVIAEPATNIGQLTTSGSWFEIQNINGTGWDMNSTGAKYITCRNCNFSGNSGVNWAAEGWSNVSWIGGSLRNFSCSSCANAMAIFASTSVAGTSTASAALVDGVTFDNIRNTGGNGNHFEVIRIDGRVNGLTIRNSVFTNSETSTSILFFSTFRGTKPENIVLENNVFGAAGSAYFAINMNYQGSVCSNWTLRYNTFSTSDGMMAGGNCPYNNITWVGNLGPRGNCEGTAFRSNVWIGSAGSVCGSSDKAVASAGTDGAYRLTAGSAAIDAGGTGCIAVDRDGNARPAGGRCDAGAHEYASTAAPAAPLALPAPQNLVIR
jgi:hypothetical protein